MITKEHKALQLFYAGVLAESVKHYADVGILDAVTTKKLNQQKAMASVQVKQLSINNIDELFAYFTIIFGCIEWKVAKNETGYEATGSSCLLCSMAQKIGAAQPCEIYCINPFKSLVGAIKPGYQLKVSETLWKGDKCEFLISNK